MMTSPRSRLSAVVAVLIVAMSACGNGGEAAFVEEAPTREQFIAQADQICEKGQADRDETPSPDTEAQAAELVRVEFVPGVRSEINAVRALSFPPEDEDELQGLLDRADAALDEIESKPDEFLFTPWNPLADVTEEMEEYGFTECG